MRNPVSFLPEWASPPGATIAEILEERGQSVAEFARSMEEPVEMTRQLLKGGYQINERVATKLTQTLGIPVNFWLERESQFRASLERVAQNEEWLREIPIKDLIKFKWVGHCSDAGEKIAACLEFFGVTTIAAWRDKYEGSERLAAFRTSESFQVAEGAVLAWLRKGEIESAKIQCNEWNPARLRAELPALRKLTRQKEPSHFIPELQRICAACGVAVVVARVPSGCRASGATKFTSPSKALMLLSFRHLSDDHFWFTFFHEVAHLLLHNSSTLFLEGGDFCSGKEEAEADLFASDLLVPPEHKEEMMRLSADAKAVLYFSRKIGISAGIVVGQLQHLGILNHGQLNRLKVRYSWS